MNNLKFILGLALAMQLIVGCGKDEPVIEENNNLPEITSVDPESAQEGDKITIYGKNFSPTPSDNLVVFSGGVSVPVSIKNVTQNAIIVLVPEGAQSGTISVTVNGNKATSPQSFTVL